MAVSDVDAYGIFTDPQLLVAGLNLHALLRVRDLPADLVDNLCRQGIDCDRYGTLLLIGNGGPAFWRAFREAGGSGSDPVDNFSVQVVSDFLSRQWPGLGYRVVYPANAAVALQALGRLAGWHHDSPLKVGINDTWGLWFAYRVLVALEGELPESTAVPSANPCESCLDRRCIAACPPGALSGTGLALESCLDYRTADGSTCADQCQARLGCPVASEHRYDPDQIQYHYGRSLRHVVAWRNRPRVS